MIFYVIVNYIGVFFKSRGVAVGCRWVCKLSVIVLAAFASVGSVKAAPILAFEFLNSGGLFAPTDTVEMRARVTNIGDMDLVNAVGQGEFLFGSPVFNEYFDPSNAVLFAPPGVINLAVGESIDWLAYSFVPFPLSGNVGDPVALGDYVFPLTDIETRFFVAAGPDSQSFTSDESGAAAFTWSVVDRTPVDIPEAASIAILSFGLLSLDAARRRAN